MADFTQDKKYNFIWQHSKFEGLLFQGDNISSLVNDAGYITSSVVVSASYALNSSYATTASYFSGSITNAISASYATTASYTQTSSFSDRTTQIDVYVLNQSGASIAKGVVVRITGSNNSSDIPRITTASYVNDGNSANTLGITTTTIANGAEGYVITEGILKGINTQAFTSGQLVYLGATGSIIGYPPMAPSHSVRLGEVIRHQSNNGSIYVRIDNGYELEELHDVYINTASLAYGDLLMRDGNNVWINSKQLSGSYNITGSLNANSFTGSLNGTASYATTASFSLTASYYRETDPIFTAKSASFATTASNNFTGTQSIAGNVIVGSTTFITSSITTPKLQLSAGSSGVIAMPVTSTPLVVESDSTTTLAIFSPNASTSQIQFGTPADEFGALLRWDYPNRNLILSTATNNSSGKIIFQTGTGNEVARFTDTVTSLTGSIQVSGSITSSLFGTASWAQNALTASYVSSMSSSVIQTLGSTLYSTNPITSNFNTTNSILLGDGAGSSSAAATGLISIGRDSGRASNAQYGIFIGDSAGNLATDAIYSIFLGNGTGIGGYKAELSNFMGFQTGFGAYSASYSNLIGYRVGASGSIGTIGTNNIIIGTNISLPNNRRDSINIGGIIFGTGSYFGNFGGDPYTGSQANGRIGIGTVTPNATLDVAGNTIITGSATATLGFTGSLSGTSSYAQNAATASYINTLNQNVIITGSLAIGTGSIGNGENNLILGPAPAGGVGEGGQIALLAVGGTYTSSSFIDNYQNQIRILSGPGATSNAGIMAIDLGTRNATFQGAVTASGFDGLPNNYLYVTRNVDQTIGSGNWANRDIIFNNVVASKGISYNTGTGLASLTGGKVYRITTRLAWGAAATYLFQFSCYNSSNTILGPTVEMVQSTNASNNISDSTLDFIYAPSSNVDIKIRTTANTTALSGEYVRGDLNTQLIIQQIA